MTAAGLRGTTIAPVRVVPGIAGRAVGEGVPGPGTGSTGGPARVHGRRAQAPVDVAPPHPVPPPEEVRFAGRADTARIPDDVHTSVRFPLLARRKRHVR